MESQRALFREICCRVLTQRLDEDEDAVLTEEDLQLAQRAFEAILDSERCITFSDEVDEEEDTYGGGE